MEYPKKKNSKTKERKRFKYNIKIIMEKPRQSGRGEQIKSKRLKRL